MILDNIDRDKYSVDLVGITTEGKWLYYEGQKQEKLKDGTWELEGKEAYILPNEKKLHVVKAGRVESRDVDVVFNIIHGNTGEDGKLQGFLELVDIPYVGSQATSSAICMDKAYTKIIVNSINVKQADYMVLKEDYDMKEIEGTIGYPCFINRLMVVHL